MLVVNLGRAGTYSGLGKSCCRLQVPLCANALTSCSGACLLATLHFLRADTPGPMAEVPPSSQPVVLVLWDVLVGFLICQQDCPKALTASLL